MLDFIIFILSLMCVSLRLGPARQDALRCGIWGGISSVLTISEVDLIRMLGAVSFPRGDDSVGMAWANGGIDKLKYGFDKAVSDPYGYLYHKNTVDFFRNLSTPRAIIGHNRSATVGSISRDNAHPFRKGDLVGVHNGTIKSLSPTFGGTDSEKLYELMSEKGPKEVLNSLEYGAYALAWFNCKEHKMYLIRNDERTLYYMHTKHKPGTVYFASERSFLAYLDARPNTPQFEDPILLTASSLYEFDLKKMGEPVVHADFVEKKPSRTFQRKAEGIQNPLAWETWEDYLEEQEVQEKEKQATVTQLFDITPPAPARPTNSIDENMAFFNNFFDEERGSPWQRIGNVPSSTRETQDKVYDIVPATLSKIPRSVLLPVDCGGFKSLKYRGYNSKLLTLNEYFHKLKQGSILNGTIPAPTAKIFWFNDKEFALEEELDDQIIKEYYDDRAPPQVGELVYVNPNKAVNRLLGTTKKGAQQNVH